MAEITRRELLAGLAGAAIAGACGGDEHAARGPSVRSSLPEVQPEGRASAGRGERRLGRNGPAVDAFSLGGEGILRTVGNHAAAVPMIAAALRAGVRYCDTAPAYAQSQEYYGATFRAMPGARDRVTLAS